MNLPPNLRVIALWSVEEIMDYDCEQLESQGALLRRLCVESHNALTGKSRGFSEVGELMRQLGPRYPALEDKSPEHLMLSSYVFWGDRSLGGSRRGFERRLERAVNSELWRLHQTVCAGCYGAWRCVEVGAEGHSRWEAIGPARQTELQAAIVTSGPSDELEAEVGDVRAGWAVEFEDFGALLFSLELREVAQGALAEAAEDDAWYDQSAPEGQRVRVIEYERDVLLQATCPGYEECGLTPHYYLPKTLRRRFPARFRRALVRTMVDALGSNRVPWHVRLARSDEDWIEDYVIDRLSKWRKKARRRAQHSYERKVTKEALVRLADEKTCLAMLGLDATGELDLSAYPPRKLHPVSMLEVDWEWLEQCGVKSGDVIKQAQSKVEEQASDEELKRWEEALEAHRIRLRWCAIIDASRTHRDLITGRPQLDYDELMAAVDYIFGASIQQLPIGELMAERKRMAPRIEKALISNGYGSEPLTVGEMPGDSIDLKIVRGVGKKSMQAIEDCLFEELSSWAEPLRRLATEEAVQARDEIEAGLDELEDLF